MELDTETEGTCASSSDGLPPLLVLHIPACKDALSAGLRGAGCGDDIAIFVCLELPCQELGSWLVSYCEEQS